MTCANDCGFDQNTPAEEPPDLAGAHRSRLECRLYIVYRQKVQGLSVESRQNQALMVLYVLYSLDSGPRVLLKFARRSPGRLNRLYIVYRQVFQLPQILHFEPCLGRFKFKARRHKFKKDSLSLSAINRNECNKTGSVSSSPGLSVMNQHTSFLFYSHEALLLVYSSQAWILLIHTLITEREFFIDNLLVQPHFIIEMMRWTGLAPWQFHSPFPGSLASTFLAPTPGDERRQYAVMHWFERSQGYLNHKKQRPPRATIGP